MLFELLLFFVAMSIVLFIIICYFLFVDNINPKTDEEEALNVKKAPIGNWRIAMVLITVNFIIIAICTLGFVNVEVFHMGHYYPENGTYVSTTTTLNVTTYLPYVWVFYVFFYIHIMLFFRAGYDAYQDAMRSKGQMDYSTYERKYRS